MKTVLELSNAEARAYFLKEESYFNFDLPKYFGFQTIIDKVSQQIEGKLLSDFYRRDTEEGRERIAYPGNFEDVNYTILNNKDGRFAWRPFQLIHPAIYVSLVHNFRFVHI